MKNKKVIIILGLALIAIIILVCVFSISIIKTNNMYFDTDKALEDSTIIGEKIVNPDRIVYSDGNGKYYEFLSDSNSYKKIKALLSNSIEGDYKSDGAFIAQDEIDKIHSKSFIEFDYKTASKNYIFQLDNTSNNAVIKLADTGGNVVIEKINNKNKINNTLNALASSEKSYTLDYKEVVSVNKIELLEYKYRQLFKEISFGILQAKIENLKDYEKFEDVCNIAIDEEITDKTFENNDIILTVSSIPKIVPKVSVGNIKYTYDKIENAQYGYTVHLLIVSKIVNTDCIYNNDLTAIANKVEQDNIEIEHNNRVENLDSEIFVTDVSEFLIEYNSCTSSISKEKAAEIAEKGFTEAERICGACDKKTQTVEETKVKVNNFFTRKMKEYDQVYDQTVEAYKFTRYDDMMLNGVSIYVDKKTGKIVGGEAFGD